MRTAIVSLIALTGFATAALAQEAAMPAAPAAPAAGAAPAAPAAPAVDPNAAAPAPAAPPAAEVPAPAPLPTLPTSGDGATIISVLERVCVPAVKGGDVAKLAPAIGMKKVRRDGGFVMRLGENKDHTLTVLLQGANKNVCQMDVRYAVDQSKPIVEGLNVWAFLHQPELKPQRRDFTVDSENKRITTSWEHYNDKESTGLVFVELRRPDGSALNAKFDTATVLYSERKF